MADPVKRDNRRTGSHGSVLRRVHGAGLIERRVGDVSWLELRSGGVRVAFTGRAGGAAAGPYAAHNLALNVGDDAEIVLANRHRVSSALGVAAGDLVVPVQVHGVYIAEVNAPDRGRGARMIVSAGAEGAHGVHAGDATANGAHGPLAAVSLAAIPDCDGLWTRTSDVPLMIATADCVAVCVAARAADGRVALALVHAGWRGMIDGIVRRACALVSSHGTPFMAAIGPSIGPCCFTVSESLAVRFADQYGSDVSPRTVAAPGDALDRAAATDESPAHALLPHVDVESDNRFRVDLWRAAQTDLIAGGVAAADIVTAGICTRCDERYFSYRGDGGVTGRQAAIAWIEPTEGEQ